MSEIQKVIVPVDFSSNMSKVVDYGVSVANQLEAEILFLHVVNDFLGYDMMLGHPSFVSMTKDLEKKAKERMANLVEDHQKLKNGVQGHVASGDAADAIIDYATAEEVDMIIIGTHGAKGLEKILIGSTADQVVKKAPCPVLVFNPFT